MGGLKKANTMTYDDFIHELDYLDDQRCNRCKRWLQTYPPKESIKDYIAEYNLALCELCNIKWHIVKH